MHGALLAGWWGFVAGTALLIGAALGYFAPIPRRLTAAIMSFGAGVLISALAFDLMDEAFRTGGFDSTAIGFLGGAVLYTAASWLVTRQSKERSSKNGGASEKGAGGDSGGDDDDSSSALALFIGALIDGIPESIAIGLSLLGGKGVSLPTVAAIFLSNIPEGISAASGMQKGGRSARYVFALHGGVVIISAVAAVIGYVLFRHVSPELVAATTAVAAGGILAMLADTMMPEAYKEARNFAGLVTVCGFLAAFILQKLGG